MASQGKTGGYRHGIGINVPAVTVSGTTPQFGSVPVDCRITTVSYVATTAVTGSDSTITVENKTQSTSSTFTLSATGLSAGGVGTLAAEVVCSAGDVLRVSSTGTASAGVCLFQPMAAQD